MNTFIRQMPGWVAALLTGVLFALSRDVGPVGPLVLIAPVPILIYALSADRGIPVALWAFIARLIGAAGLVLVYAGQLPTPVLVTGVLIYGAEFAVVLLTTRFACRHLPPWLGVLSYPLLVTACEFLLEFTSPNGTFGALGYSMAEVLPLVQVASIGGVSALSFMASLLPMGIALLALTPQQWRPIAVAAGVPWIAAMAFGAWRLSLPYQSETHVALAAIDALTLQAVIDEEHADEVAGTYEKLIRQIGAGVSARPLVLVLPEKVFAYRVGWRTDAIAALQRAADETGVTVVAGFDEELEAGNTPTPRVCLRLTGIRGST